MIEIKDFQKKYNNRLIVKVTDNIVFRDNAISFIMGPNGAGKTTLIKCIFGLESFEGTISVDSVDNPAGIPNGIAIWDDCPFYTNLSGKKNLLIFGENKKQKNEVLETAGKYLSSDVLNRRVKSYSYGQKKKLALALVDILEPKYLFMDEISNGLDYESVRSLKKHLRRLSEQMTIVLTGHQFAFYQDLYDDLFLIKKQVLQKHVKDNNDSLEDVYDEELLE